MPTSARDQELLARQAALQAEAAQVLAELDLGRLFGDVWHRLPSYPDAVGGWEIYTAVLRDGVRTPEQFADWLADNGFPDSDAAVGGVA